ncbi:MAG: hypothetical protein [Caudoviricetes sp.]|nr:MAG: hypothetical protein [Caudoviricetes sp.]
MKTFKFVKNGQVYIRDTAMSALIGCSGSRVAMYIDDSFVKFIF